MKLDLRSGFLAVALLLAASPAWATCSGQAPAGAACGNSTSAQAVPSWVMQSALLDRNFGAPSAQGTILNRGASVWSATSVPVLGRNGGTGGSITLNGATSGAAVVGVAAAAGTTNFRLPVGNGTNGFVLVTDGAGNTSWQNNAAGGTVQSVGLSMPGIFSVSGSPVTTTGTLTATLANQSANLVWAGPGSGAAAAPTFRALVGADLPVPSASTLGGIQSYAGVASQWIRSISTSGVAASSQPAFSDISGTLGPAQCPNPSASTLGCVQSYVGVGSQWIRSISTSGVPASSQPAFSDLSGNASLGQLPSIGNNTILGNVAGGSASPLALAPSTVFDTIGATQGQIFYRNGSVWTVLNPGTNGQVLTTGGAAANPSWSTVTGTGTVTSVGYTAGTGLALSGTASPITGAGSFTYALASIANGTVLANTSGSLGAPTATTPSSVLDAIGSTQGSVLYRGASTWSALTPGTNGQFLQTTGAGSTPQWASAVRSIAGNSGVFTLNSTSGITNSVNDIQCSQGSSSQFGCVKVDNTTMKATAGVISQSLTNATLQATTGTPAGTTSASLVMAGLGGACKITPVYSGRIMVHFQLDAFNSVTGNTSGQFRYGTGAAPANGAAATGTAVGSTVVATSASGAYRVPMTIGGIVTGLTPGTAYWLDVGFSANTGTASLENISCSAMEF